MHTNGPVNSARRGLLERGFQPVSEMTARLALAAKAKEVAVLYSWMESVPSGNSATYGATLSETPDGVGHPSRGWEGRSRTVRELIANREQNTREGRTPPSLEWFVRPAPVSGMDVRR